MRVSTVVVAAAALLAVTASPAAAADATDDPAYFWRWADGSSAHARTLSEARLDGRLPALLVDTLPATPGRAVTLQYRDHGRWRTEDSAVTGATGSVRLELNPYCADGAWCARAFEYRLLAGARTASLTVTFTR